jgi:tetratricopeptide (TPR) repeat protein
MDQGRFPEAAPHIRRAAAIRARTDDPDHPSRVITGMNLASLELALGNPGRAVALYREGLERLERVAGVDSPAAVRARSLLGIALHRLGESRQAERLLRACLERQRSGDRELDLADTLAGLGSALVDLGREREALPLMEEALALRVRRLAAGHWSIAELRIELGGALLQLGRDTDGRAQIATGRAALVGLPGHDWAVSRALRFDPGG